jgi:hypothetical protein
MKRLAWSLVGGFGIPALYTLALALFFLWTKNVRLVLRLRFPVAWPRYVLVPRSFRLIPFKTRRSTISNSVSLYLRHSSLTRFPFTFSCGEFQYETERLFALIYHPIRRYLFNIENDPLPKPLID